jgi:glycosyltransferase involved in cell wall biosynthesis
MKKKVLIVTHIFFWSPHAGDQRRLLSLVLYLKAQTKLSIVVGGVPLETDLKLIKCLGLENDIVFLDREKQRPLDEYGRLFENYLLGNPVEVCIIEYVFLSFLLQYIPEHITVILDAHDIGFKRQESISKLNPGIALITDIPKEDELRCFKLYDLIVLLQKDDLEFVGKIVGNERVILAPHPTPAKTYPTRKTVKTIGFVASDYPPNVDAAKWFITKVWPLLKGLDIVFNLYGKVGSQLNFKNGDKIYNKGIVPDLESVYGDADIFINPVRFGAGLKIKTVEALGNGKPLVTTTHGSTGLDDGRDIAFLLADEPIHFYNKLLALIDNYDLRVSLSHSASDYAKRNYSVEKCFNPLLAEILGHE